ncbi:probable cyclin-dependent serine/threonine-protein kinase DDB_G0292550 [Penaeus monodon]|uniref:probable cyclin-dependent serine/threonine-protein kinase DDB_G0292550 n=1 Tax=Penaeus monodon TaxID=6687 RepID=UPI0018A7DECD|nr:probable cyclin-dependent serine/threonine-protein kinase DDB_G0292550 [Penaeus monodon]
MKALVVVALAAAAVGQQFQQQRQYDTAVRLATPGYFQQGGSFTSPSFRNTNSQLQGDSFQNSFQTATSDSNSFRQSGLFQNSNQLQRNADTNTNQFQTTSFPQSSFDSNAFQQNSGSPFQQNSNAQSGNSFFQSGSNQFGSDNRFQTNTNQINSGSRFQSSFDNQNSNNRFQSSFDNQNSNNRFQSTFDNQDSNNRFQSTFNNQDSNNRFQSTFNNQNSNNRFSQNSQSSSFLRSGSSFDSSTDSVSGVFEPLNLPSGASALLGSITSSFSCLDRPYGYYADQDNSCRVFHVCNPTLFSNGAVETYQYSFMCGEGSVFDQKELACVAESSAIPCQESSSYFYTNEQFGRPEDKSLYYDYLLVCPLDKAPWRAYTAYAESQTDLPKTFDRVYRPSQPDYIRTRHSSQVIVGRTSPHVTDMKALVVVALAAAAVGQQFQQQRQYDTAVRLATPGYFQQGGSFTSPSFRNTNGQLQGDSFQNSFQTATSDSNSFRQSGLFQNSNQLQRNADTNTNQFQTTSFQQSSFDSNAFQQNSGSPFQQNSNIPIQLRQPGFQQPIPSTFDNQDSTRFQSNFDNQNSNNRFQSTFNNQDSNRFQSTFNNQDSSNRFSQNSQSSSFLRSSSSFDSSSDSVSGVFEPLNLPSGASALLGSITSSFSCLDRPYGYYADQDNSCRVFHVCNPTLFSNGAVETYQYSFMCGEGSVFNQKELACVAESSAIPCQESSSYFYTNEQFGRPEDKSF